MCRNYEKMCRNDDKMRYSLLIFGHNSFKGLQKMFPGKLESLHQDLDMQKATFFCSEQTLLATIVPFRLHNFFLVINHIIKIVNPVPSTILLIQE